jgi:hypothetical protein
MLNKPFHAWAYAHKSLKRTNRRGSSPAVVEQQFAMRLSLDCSGLVSPRCNSWHETCIGGEIGD